MVIFFSIFMSLDINLSSLIAKEDPSGPDAASLVSADTSANDGHQEHRITRDKSEPVFKLFPLGQNRYMVEK